MDCIFCKISKNEIPSKTIYEDDLVKVFMDINPISSGHMLIIPKKHYSDFLELDEKINNHIHKISKDISNLLIKKLNPDGLRLVTNYGINQDVKHYHLHIIPSYKAKDNISNVDDIFNKLIKWKNSLS